MFSNFRISKSFQVADALKASSSAAASTIASLAPDDGHLEAKEVLSVTQEVQPVAVTHTWATLAASRASGANVGAISLQISSPY
jgi:hypothetical protein